MRAAEIRRIAELYGFHYMGEVLPPSLPLRDLPLLRITSVWNAIDGERRGRRVVAFDCRFGEGKGSWRRTVIAVRTEVGNVGASVFAPDVSIEQYQSWAIIWRPKKFILDKGGLMPIMELRARLESL